MVQMTKKYLSALVRLWGQFYWPKYLEYSHIRSQNTITNTNVFITNLEGSYKYKRTEKLSDIYI